MSFLKIKSFVVVSMLVFGSISVWAQPTIKIGGTYADLDLNDNALFDVTSNPNLFLGLHYQLFFTDVIGIEPGITYQRLTSTLKTPIADFKLNRDYIGIPVLIKIIPNSILSFGGGVQAGFLMKDNLSDNFENKNFTLSGQLQATFNPVQQFGIELGYNFGFTPYIEFTNKEVGDFQFQNGDGSNKYFYAAFLINLR
ncbi:MAG: outer membrane beta-barrel protein [Saprospiraceae bacterium]|nr:outer membrane beta-barrel protein [Saprospiraceae bacterium]MBK8634538.1 outer membrane beta-barrel protein [Saprospiraceae bacterium]